ncbi:MAG: LysM peptidoglycan-binding domain-containing protein [Clostridia bacterium]|nr:LysM peptidoglycan-binding domain-containing protein [Clostridia bacterium]
MYELKLAKSRYYRVKRGQSASDIENTLCMPVPQNIREGMIIEVPRCNFFIYKADVGDTYSSVAQKFGLEAEELRRVNGGRAVFPTCRIFIPCK